jgi:two-component system sensor histidine kinase AgrC
MDSFIIWQYRISHFFMILFLVYFLTLRYRKWVTGITAVFFYAACVILEEVGSQWQLSQIAIMGLTVMQVGVIQGMAFLLDKYRDFRTLFTGFSSAVYIIAGNMIGTVIYIFSKKAVLSLLIGGFVHAVFLVILVYGIRKNYLQEQKYRKSGWTGFSLVPLVIFVCVYTIMVYPGSLYEHVEYGFTVLAILVLMVLSYYFIFVFLAGQRHQEMLEQNNEYLKNSSRQLVHEVKILEESERKTAILRHDLRHYVLTLHSYLENRQYDKMEEFLLKLRGEVEHTGRRKYCSNLVLDSIFSYYGEVAERERVEYNVLVEVPGELFVQEDEIASVCSNLLDNAVIAAAREPKKRVVTAQMKQEENRLLLEVVNTFSGKFEVSDETGLPVSENGEGHGYGLRSVSAFAEKYDAFFQWRTAKGLFSVQMILWNKNKQEKSANSDG